MRDRKPAAARRRNGEEGSAIIVALIMMVVLMTVSLAATSVRVASARGADSRERQQDEYWGARSGASAVEASLRTDIPARYDADVASAKQMAGSRRLPSFDAQSVTASQSRPVMNTDGQRSSNDIASCTSLLGNINTWASARLGIAEAYAQQLGHNARVAVLREAFRPQLAGGNAFAEGAYALEFYIDAAAGENGRVRPSGLVMLGPAVQGCNTAVTLNTSPSTITQGQSASLVVTYENATRIVVSESGGAVIANQVVTESGATQTISFSVTPATTTTYVATATNATGCRADSAPRTLTVTIPPPRIVLFEANPSCIILGDSSTLRWTIEGATGATINGFAVNPVSGSGPVSPTADTTYTLVASNSGGSTQAQVTVSVTIPPRVNLFAADDSCVIAGDSTTLRWNVADAATVTINGTPVNPALGSLTVTPAANTTYTIVATGSGCAPQTVQAQVTVNVTTPPRINSFTGAPTTIIRGSGVSVLLAWGITGATGATINGAAVNPSSGTMSVMPNVTTTYTLVATGGGCSPQQRQATVTIVVEDDPAPGSCPAINRLTAAPSCLIAGQGSQIAWDVTDADTIALNGSPVALSGSLNVTPAATTVYTLVASRPGCAPEQRQVTVEVATPPTINSFSAAPDIIQQGQTTSLQWNVSDAASVTIDGVPVNPASGSLPVSPNATRTYTIIATGGGCSPQQRQATVTVTVNPCPTINFFSASPPDVTVGGTSTLQWSVSNASAVTINGSPVGASGSMPVTPGSTTSYRLVAQSASGGCDVEQTVTVTVTACAAPEIVSFTANPSSVAQGAGGLVRLAWQINDPSGTGVTVSISPGVGGGLPQTGFVDISAPAATTEYVITATSGCGVSSTQRVTVTVTSDPGPCPLPAPGQPQSQAAFAGAGMTEGSFSVPTNSLMNIVAQYYPGGRVTYRIVLQTDDASPSGDPANPVLWFVGSGSMGSGVRWSLAGTVSVGQTGSIVITDPSGTTIATAPVTTRTSGGQATFEAVGEFTFAAYNYATAQLDARWSANVNQQFGGARAIRNTGSAGPRGYSCFTSGPCPAPAPGSPAANTGGGSGGAFSISGGAGRVDTQVRIFYHAEYYPDATVRYNLRLEVSSDPDGSQSHFLVSGGAGGREGLIGPNLGWAFYSGFCHGKSGFCGLRFLDAAGNVILESPFQSIQQPPGANMRIYTLVGDDGSFFTTPGVSLPYPNMDFTNDRIRLNSFAVNAGNIAAFSTNKGTFNTSVSGTQSSWRCP